LPPVTVPTVGAPGNVAGVTAALGIDAALVPVPPAPVPFDAVTVNVYGVPLVRPVTVIGLAVPDAICPPLEVTV
jgi:hypothetical protein